MLILLNIMKLDHLKKLCRKAYSRTYMYRHTFFWVQQYESISLMSPWRIDAQQEQLNVILLGDLKCTEREAFNMS